MREGQLSLATMPDARKADDPEIARFVVSLPNELRLSGLARFRADPRDAALSRGEGDFMVSDFWRAGGGVRPVRRQWAHRTDTRRVWPMG